MSEELQQRLRTQLWDVANKLRGNMTAGDFMYFTLGFIFYKYLSQKIELYIDDQLSEDGLTLQTGLDLQQRGTESGNPAHLHGRPWLFH